MAKILIEVSGGVVTNISSTDEVSIFLVDHDNIKEKGDDVSRAREPFQPDRICESNEEFEEVLNETLSDYEDAAHGAAGPGK